MRRRTRKGNAKPHLQIADGGLELAYADVGLTPERIYEITPLQAMLICMHWTLEARNPATVLAAASVGALRASEARE